MKEAPWQDASPEVRALARVLHLSVTLTATALELSRRTDPAALRIVTHAMDADIAQLVEMGATRAQARAALKKYRDVMQAAERFFDGEFENVADDDVEMASDAPAPVASGSKPPRKIPVCVCYGMCKEWCVWSKRESPGAGIR
jgi:hypothetical protein